ncbi:MAG: hypothetical protein KC413_06475, partial [Anaerolineales bacterium]|nr:hypothetical protein [Anaerolineales bacterium]
MFLTQRGKRFRKMQREERKDSVPLHLLFASSSPLHSLRQYFCYALPRTAANKAMRMNMPF